MSPVLTEREAVMAEETERARLAEISEILSHPTSHRIMLDDEAIELPPSLLLLLRQMVALLAAGEAVRLVPLQTELTTREAADLLNVSRQYLVQLLSEEKIPYYMVGTHHRVYLHDLLDYKQRRDTERQQHRNRLVQLSEKAGLYARE